MVVLAAALATSCEGGQTGHAFGGCESIEIADSAAWSGTTVQAAAAAFEGTYSGSLQWQVESRYEGTHTLVAFPDTAQLTIDYAGDGATVTCNQLNLPVLVTFTTSNSDINESARATLQVEQSSEGLIGSLVYSSDQIKLGATLDEVALAHAPRGSFDALDPTLPGASATFTENP